MDSLCIQNGYKPHSSKTKQNYMQDTMAIFVGLNKVHSYYNALFDKIFY